MKYVKLSKSDRVKKKYKAIIYDKDMNKLKTLHFGAKGASDFTKNKDEKRKENYLARHKPRENWEDIETAGAWARFLLWNKPTIRDSLRDISNRFDVQFI